MLTLPKHSYLLTILTISVLTILTLHTSVVAQVTAQETDRPVSDAMSTLRDRYANKPHRYHQIRGVHTESTEAYLEQLSPNGLFSDLTVLESSLRASGDLISHDYDAQRRTEKLTTLSFNRIWCIAETLRGQSPDPTSETTKRLLQAIIHYGEVETSRPDGRFRFHPSCFAIPTAAINTYFCLMPIMDAVETGSETGEHAMAANQVLKALAMQAWTLPGRNDATDSNPVQVDRFRHHVWWVGGNGLAYRSVFPAAIVLNRSDMLDVLSEVAHGALSAVSYNTQETAFWTEGMTTDGAGWGHGRQALVFGYPFDGTSAALGIIREFKGTAWDRPLSEESVLCLLNLLRGSSWFWYRDRVPPMYDRSNMVFKTITSQQDHKGRRLAQTILKSFEESLTDDQHRELRWYADHARAGSRFTDNPPYPDQYKGVRYFWNQDDLVVKHDDWYFVANMSSSRTHGLESADQAGVAGLNLFTADGQTLFQKRGEESILALGASDLTALPGITGREFKDPLRPITHWTGYHSKHNYAGGVANSTHGCAGFIFEKQDGKIAHEDPSATQSELNPKMYGVYAIKGYFVFDDSIVLLGAGIKDNRPELGGHVRTSVEQTIWTEDVTIAGHAGDQSQTYNASSTDPADIQVDLTDTTAGPLRVHHGAFSYAILPKHTSGTARIILEQRATKWDELARNNKDAVTPDTEKMLQIILDHGFDPSDASYGYIVRHNPGAQEIPSRNMPKVLSNTPEVQAVTSHDGTIVQAIFYDESGQLNAGGWEVTVSAPAVIMIEPTSGGWSVTASDPLQSPSPLPLKVTVHRDGFEGSTILDLPVPPLAGSQTKAAILFNEK